MKFERAAATPEAIRAYIVLFHECFPTAPQYTFDYLTWLYSDNPAGKVFGFDALDGDQLVAHYACIPAPVSLGRNDVTALLSLNTATHPKHQGKGLFTKLADQTYAAAQAEGFLHVYGVANQSSIRGFTRRLGFQDVVGLDARIGFGSPPPLDWQQVGAHSQAAFVRRWSSTNLAWRMSNPANPLIACRSGSDSLLIVGRTQYSWLRVVGLVEKVPVAPPSPTVTPLIYPRLTLGLVPALARRTDLSFPIPDKLKPSPLRLIYRNLLDATDRLDSSAILFQFIDFDAY